MPKPRRNHSTRTHAPHGRYHAVPRPAGAGVPATAAVVMAAAVRATAAGSRVLVAAIAPRPRLVLSLAGGPADLTDLTGASVGRLDSIIIYPAVTAAGGAA